MVTIETPHFQDTQLLCRKPALATWQGGGFTSLQVQLLLFKVTHLFRGKIEGWWASQDGASTRQPGSPAGPARGKARPADVAGAGHTTGPFLVAKGPASAWPQARPAPCALRNFSVWRALRGFLTGAASQGPQAATPLSCGPQPMPRLPSDLIQAGGPAALTHKEAVLEGLTLEGTMVLSAMHQEGDPHAPGGRPHTMAALPLALEARQRWHQLPQPLDPRQTP